MLTLAVCKPAIRRTARAGDYLVGIGSNTWYPGKLIYVAQIEQPIAGAVYYQKNGPYWTRHDCIYEFLGGTNYRWLSRGGRRVHDPAVMPGQKNRDVGQCRGRSNARVLPSRRFAYFGRDLADNSAAIWAMYPHILATVKSLQQSHLVHHSAGFKRQLIEFCEALLTTAWRGGPILDEPHHRPSAKTCHDNRSSACFSSC